MANLWTLSNALLGLGTYLLGSISTALVLVRLGYLADPRHIGSGNIGATNVLRQSKRHGLLVFLGDSVKGMIAVLIALYLNPDLIFLTVLTVTMGHCFPVFHGFRGGKGVATAFGAILIADAYLAGMGMLGFVLTLISTRRVSLASVMGAVCAALSYPFWYALMPPWPLVLCALLITVRHRGNFQRILNGTEPKI